MTAHQLALRELRRTSSRFRLLVAAVAVLSFLVVLQQALLIGLVGQLNGGLRSSDADLYVLGAAADGALPASEVAGDAVGVARAIDGVEDAGSVRFGAATVVIDGAETDVSLVGVDPGQPGGPAVLTRGRSVEHDNEAVASAADAAAGMGSGATVRIQPRGQPLQIVGLGDDANLNVAPTLYVPTTTFLAITRDQRPAALRSPPRSAVAVRLAAGAGSAVVARSLAEAIPDAEVLTRAEAAQRFPGVAEVTESFAIVLGLLGIVVALVAGLFFLILTVQKAPTLTLLSAVGMRTRTLVAGLLIQVLVVVGAGIAIGTAVAAALLGSMDFGFDASLDLQAAATSATAIMTLVLLAALASVRRVLRVDPATALAGGVR
jgi:putative ABC transport system permease protein